MKWVVTLAIFFVAAYLTIAFNWTYSDGNRAGYIQKFSRKGKVKGKGWMCKTHEGELAMTTVSGKAGHVVRLITGWPLYYDEKDQTSRALRESH
jgi:hypothetical protein